MAELKTQRTDASVPEFLAGVADPGRRTDAEAVCALMAAATGAEPAMWGTAIVGFGAYRYRYGSGRTAEWPAVGLSPRKQNLTIYLSDGFEPYADLLARLGPHTLGRACLYVKRLSDVDTDVLRTLVGQSFRRVDGHALTPEGGWER